jgi:hypothetical protein
MHSVRMKVELLVGQSQQSRFAPEMMRFYTSFALEERAERKEYPMEVDNGVHQAQLRSSLEKVYQEQSDDELDNLPVEEPDDTPPREREEEEGEEEEEIQRRRPDAQASSRSRRSASKSRSDSDSHDSVSSAAQAEMDRAHDEKKRKHAARRDAKEKRPRKWPSMSWASESFFYYYFFAVDAASSVVVVIAFLVRVIVVVLVLNSMSVLI